MREQPDQRVVELRLANRLREVRVEQPLHGASLVPAERAEQHERQRGVPLPDLRGQRDAVHLRHVHVDDREIEDVTFVQIQRNASPGDPVVRGCMPHLRSLQRQHTRGSWRCRRR